MLFRSITNIKIDKATSKLLPFILVGSIATNTLTGCGCEERESILKGTILEGASIITFDDGSKDIAVAIDTCDSSFYSHYYSVISGQYFSDDTCSQKFIELQVNHHYAIDSEESIIGYLTLDDLEKAVQGTLNNEDVIAIFNRIVDSTSEIKTNIK